MRHLYHRETLCVCVCVCFLIRNIEEGKGEFNFARSRVYRETYCTQDMAKWRGSSSQTQLQTQKQVLDPWATCRRARRQNVSMKLRLLIRSLRERDKKCVS